MLKDPALYSVGHDYLEDDPALVQKRADIVHTAAVLLEKCFLVKYERASGRFQSTELGRIASHYYVSYNSMATYNQHLRPTMTTIELFRVFALSQEFKLLPVRQDVSNHSIKSLRPFIAPAGKIGAGKTTRACTHPRQGECRRTCGKDQRPSSSIHLAAEVRRYAHSRLRHLV